MLVLLAVQAAGPAPLLVRRDCTAGSEGEVVVCGRRDNEPYRLRPIKNTERYDRRKNALPRAAVSALGGTLSAEGESAELLSGQISKRAMVKFRRPF